MELVFVVAVVAVVVAVAVHYVMMIAVVAVESQDAVWYAKKFHFQKSDSIQIDLYC